MSPGRHSQLRYHLQGQEAWHGKQLRLCTAEPAVSASAGAAIAWLSSCETAATLLSDGIQATSILDVTKTQLTL